MFHLRDHVAMIAAVATLALPLLAASPAWAQDGCVTQTLSLLVFYEDTNETAAAITENIRPPLPMTPPPGEEDGMAEPPLEPVPPPPPVSAECPTLILPAADTRAQTACKMADDLPGARCTRLWSRLTLVIEPFD